MGNRVMDMQDVEVVYLRHLSHAGGQRQVIRRIFKQGVQRDGDLMKQDARVVGIQPDGLLVGDEMDLMPAVGKLNSQLRADHATATVSWITGDSDFQKFPLQFACRG